MKGSPSRVVENIGTFSDRKAFWTEKDVEEKAKRESVSSLEGIENSAFIGEQVIDSREHPIKRTPSPYEIERSKEALLLDTDEDPGGDISITSPERKVVGFAPPREESSEEERSHGSASLREVRSAASTLVQQIESSVEQSLGITPKEESSVDITDEELLSIGDISSPETQRTAKSVQQKGEKALVAGGSSITISKPEDTYAVRSSSSGEFFTAPEDSTLKSSDDDPSRPKSWDSSILGQVSPLTGGGASSEELYHSARMSAVSGASSQESYLGSLSSDASYSETLVASQIDLGRDRDLLLEEEDSPSGSPLPPALPPRDHPPPQQQQQQQQSQGSPSVSSRSVHCEAGVEGDLSSSIGAGGGYPITLTSSTSGTTVCTQVETSRTFEARVKGDPQREDDQEGNIFMDHSNLQSSPSVGVGGKKTHRRSESQSWNESSLLYGVEERIEEEQAKEIADLFLLQGEGMSLGEDPIERPITPEPGFSPEERKIGYYPGSSFDQHQLGRDFQDEIEESGGGGDFDSIFERSSNLGGRLEDIEEENGSLKNSPKSVQSLEITMGASGPEWNPNNGNGNGGVRPGSRESTSSLKEFERLETAVLEEDGEKPGDLSEIEEGHESQVSESDETEHFEGAGGDEPDSSTYDDNLLLDSDTKMMKIFSERVDLPTDSESSSSFERKLDLENDPIDFFTQTVHEPRSPETDTSQFEDFAVLTKSGGGTTTADSSIEFLNQKVFQREGTTDSARMTSSGDSLEEILLQRGQTPTNLMQVSKDSLDLDELEGGQEKTLIMTDSLQGRLQGESGTFEPGMSDSLEGPIPPLTLEMTSSIDSLSGAGVRSSNGRMNSSTDSLEGQLGRSSMSTSSSTAAADAAIWSSTSGASISTLVSSQEDLTLENQF